MKQGEMDIIVDIIDKALKNPTLLEYHKELRDEIHDLCKKFPIYK
jgi:glycine/serine hydroxymethyltransferase